MTKTFEPLWWSLFSAGGVVAALFLPIMILLSGIAMPLEWVDGDVFSYQRVLGLVSHPIARIFLFGVISLPLFHTAHRMHAALSDPWLKHMETLLSVVLYGGAFTGTIVTAMLIFRL
ncbi:MAG: fumarate reductase subunit FrdD [bacterium]